MYSSTSNLTRKICTELGFIFEINFVETMQRASRVYVRGTCGKPDEFRALKYAAENAGYIYMPRHAIIR